MSGAPLAPGATIGILGGGQLGRMLAVAAAQLGLHCHIYCDAGDAPAYEVAARYTVGAYDDEAALEAFGRSVDVVTIEFENVPAAALAAVAKAAAVHPPLKAVEVSQDRLAEKAFLRGLGVPVAPFTRAGSLAELEAAATAVGLPALLKTRRLGYDGRGQVKLDKGADLGAALDAIGHVPALLEAFVAFETEVSVIAVRSGAGEIAFYDPAQNRHAQGILAETRVPAAIAPEVADQARDIARRVAQAFNYVGVLCVEMFCLGSGDDRLLVNEIAPRVHNSGHWTLDACLVSQFENHIRAVAGWPLGSTERHSDAVMTNLIGADADRWLAIAREDAALHLYGKTEARPGRKMGHVTRLMPKT